MLLNFKAPSVVGELVAGILIGLSVLDLIGISPTIHLLAQVGIILLLFEVGIDTDIGRLTSSGMEACLVAIGGITFPS